MKEPAYCECGNTTLPLPKSNGKSSHCYRCGKVRLAGIASTSARASEATGASNVGSKKKSANVTNEDGDSKAVDEQQPPKVNRKWECVKDWTMAHGRLLGVGAALAMFIMFASYFFSGRSMNGLPVAIRFCIIDDAQNLVNPSEIDDDFVNQLKESGSRDFGVYLATKLREVGYVVVPDQGQATILAEVQVLPSKKLHSVRLVDIARKQVVAIFCRTNSVSEQYQSWSKSGSFVIESGTGGAYYSAFAEATPGAGWFWSDTNVFRPNQGTGAGRVYVKMFNHSDDTFGEARRAETMVYRTIHKAGLNIASAPDGAEFHVEFRWKLANTGLKYKVSEDDQKSVASSIVVKKFNGATLANLEQLQIVGTSPHMIKFNDPIDRAAYEYWTGAYWQRESQLIRLLNPTRLEFGHELNLPGLSEEDKQKIKSELKKLLQKQ